MKIDDTLIEEVAEALCRADLDDYGDKDVAAYRPQARAAISAFAPRLAAALGPEREAAQRMRDQLGRVSIGASIDTGFFNRCQLVIEAYDAAVAGDASPLLNPDMPAQELRLHMGEMTAQEIRTVRAAIRWANSRMTTAGEAG